MLDAVRRVKSLSVMKNILEKIYLEAITGTQSGKPDPVPVKMTPPEREMKPAAKKGKNEIPRRGRLPESIKNFVENLRENPDEFVDLVSMS